MFQIFRKNRPRLPDLGFLKTDIHSHLIPGIDDGSQSIEDSIRFIKGMHELGFEQIITTPHVMADLYPNTPETILGGLEKVKMALKSEGINVRMAAAAEYMLDDGFEALLESQEILTIGPSTVLFEMSMISGHPGLESFVFKIRTKGYRPLLAHPERYVYLKDQPKIFTRLKDMGCLLQLNLLSLTGYYGSEVKKQAFKILENGLIDYLGTDLHHERHLARLQVLLDDKRINRVLQDYPFRNKELVV